MLHLLSFLLLVTLAVSKRINLYARPIDAESSSDPIGFIEDDSVYLMDFDLQPHQSYCIGTKDLHNHECFSFQPDLRSFNNSVFNVYLTEDGDIHRLALSFDENATAPKIKKHRSITAPQPNMNPESLKKQREEQQKQSAGHQGERRQKVVQRKIVKIVNEKGEEEEQEVEEEVEVVVDDRSWIQKNWMYIVPPLIIFLLLGGGGDAK
ncbi:uncharacterized protein LODBEIA_P19810 [Lodderomyces beijingensis]|uniref:ER membrane protein complex subunit 10 n=1 Tax=Lodderomyces beijingensis TaxID=1775926 RepID=A0ABP0ZNK0_9ASCO